MARIERQLRSMSTSFHKGIIPSVAAVFAVAIAAQLLSRPEAPRAEVHVESHPDLPGWTSRPLAFGATEAASGHAVAVLNFDRYVYRHYERGAAEFQVYAAHWSSGRMPPQLVASHTPDQCWTALGWTCEAVDRVEVPGDRSKRLRPAQARTFVATDGTRIHVLYWHVVGGEDYFAFSRFNQVPDVLTWISSAWVHILGKKPTQYFVRLTSPRMFQELADDEGWQELLSRLPKWDLARSELSPSGRSS